ncbi:MAG: glutamine synthetase III [Weeksellaceae bacterium]|nr:glutamine synthetase III [Weeksellaceae bacterium]
MLISRKNAYQEALNRTSRKVELIGKNSGYFGEEVFHEDRMREYLPDSIFNAIQDAIYKGTKIDRTTADSVASAMKDWALERGATHYTHWFQPLTGTTAEKHEAFLKIIGPGRSIDQFSGSLLVQQESDASSFPNGGIRNTFETRGYTAWDPSSPAFMISNTLCIPTIFIAYTGEALDYKMPLIKALDAVDKAAVSVCQYFDKEVKKVNATLGWEQEYFLVDKAFYNARPDIVMTGRILFGKAPAKGQQLEDHYFGSIPSRVAYFMREFEIEALKLGIPVVTRHNEVAPNQFECAPIFEECNLANDHNLLLMDILNKIARRHDLRVLLHEKPFPGVNGSGKHNNWSLSTDTGVNLLSPGKNPKSNLQFLTFFVNTIKAIHDYNDVLRASIASASNDHRLGGLEAPPAIISVFIGTYLSSFLDSLEKSIKAGKMTPDDKTELKLNIGKIPQLLLDNTDRNRTSPIAFTGNKFEYRAVGSSANCAQPMIALNTIVAKQLREFKQDVDKRIEDGMGKDEAILKELQKLIKASKAIRFEGNGYSEEWKNEAEKRGLKNLKDTPAALEIWEDEKVIQLFEEMKIFSKRELVARQDIEYEKYIKQIQIEARILSELILSNLIPAVITYQNTLIQNIKGLEEVFGKEDTSLVSVQKKLLTKIAKRLDTLQKLSAQMQENRKEANKIKDNKEKAFAYRDKVLSFFDAIRYEIDKLEALTDDEIWPFPKLREMMFIE